MSPGFPHTASPVVETRGPVNPEKDLFVDHDKPVLPNGIADSASKGYQWCEGCQRYVSVARGFTPDTGECRVCLHSLSKSIYDAWMTRLHGRHAEQVRERPAILGYGVMT